MRYNTAAPRQSARTIDLNVHYILGHFPIKITCPHIRVVNQYTWVQHLSIDFSHVPGMAV